MNTNFGTGEEGAMVKAAKLEPGVRISGSRFDRVNTLIVQEVRSEGSQKVRVDVIEQETGDHLTRTLYAFAPVACWGRI
jgi:hypothetical protein